MLPAVITTPSDVSTFTRAVALHSQREALCILTAESAAKEAIKLLENPTPERTEKAIELIQGIHYNLEDIRGRLLSHAETVNDARIEVAQ
ncbi:hypothetical protein A1OW_10380 [Enterovibrio norvegicus]|nr:hypothetical protein A1OW_10380 [Enterovibrio norvegicus]